MAISEDSFESLIRNQIFVKNLKKTSTIGLSLQERPKGNVRPDFSRLNSREIKSLVSVVSRTVQNFLLLKIHPVKSSSL